MNQFDNKSINFNKKTLCIAIGYVILGGGFSTGVGSAVPNDLNMYKQPTLGKTNLLLMIDSTAGMDDEQSGKPTRSIAKDYPTCVTRNLKSESVTSLDSKYQFSNTLKDSSGRVKPTFVYPMPYCDDGTSEFKYSRMDRMKVAMTKLLSSTDISDDVVMGMGQFSTQTSKQYVIDSAKTAQNNNTGSLPSVTQYFYTQNDGYKGLGGGDGASAKILLPAAPLSLDQRWKMRVAVNALNSGSRTPLAAALAESGAYMLGRTTLNSDGTSPGGTVLTGQSKSNSASSNSTTAFQASGFNSSIDTSKSGSNYQSPITSNTASCNSNGIFLLTNAAPSQTESVVAQGLMRNALFDPNFTCPVSSGGTVLKSVTSEGKDYAWTCMGEFAKRLKNSGSNIKVAVAGFGNNFMPYMGATASAQYSDSNGNLRKYYKCNNLTVGQSYTVNGVSSILTQDTVNACNLGEKANNNAGLNDGGIVGGFGEGGFYPIVSPEELVNSIKSFVADLQTSIPSLNSGLPAIPTDTLNTTQQLPFAYYSQFQSDTRSSQAVGIWVGNIKKFQAFNNTFKDKNSNNIIDTNGNLASTTDFWSISTDGANAISGGVSAKLPVQTVVGRKIYTNRSVTGSTVSEITAADTALTLIASNNTTATTGTAEVLSASSDPDKAYLLNLLGFGISTSSVPAALTNATQLRQMGATINSTPVAFTTQSKIATKASGSGATLLNVGDYINRKDYILFGTAQGLLQVVDSSTGEEKFSFLPKEMIDRQKQGFIAKSLQSTLPNFYSGIDGAWSVYANYVTNDESNSLKADTLNVYGGLRRGGANYYGLDLKNIETGSPKILFKTLGTTAIDPITGIPTGACSNTTPLTCMGQSWSKPTIGWVKWKGKPQLVMIVGGGYDPVYDTNSYKSDTTATKGNGVYMFAANTNTDTGLTAGALMWWGSSSATATAATDTEAAKTTNSNLKYSVVSEIKAIDRDSDGFIDNLYFGDLGGQVFRADINNLTSTTTTLFDVKRIVRIGNFVADTERAVKTAPRFYSMPIFTVHRIGDLAGVINATRFAVISVGSGDQSNPVLNSLNDLNGMPDRVYGIFDKDIGREDLYSMLDADTTSKGLLTGTAEVSNMLDLAVTTAATTGAATLANMQLAETKGWFNTLAGSTLGTTATSNLDPALTGGIARFKVLSKFTAIKNTLFTSYFDAADNGSSTSCSAGIKGRSYIKNYCLPFGSMGADGMNCGVAMDGRLYSGATAIGSDVGAGVIPVIIGGMNTSGGTAIGPLAGKAGAVSAQYKTPLRFEPLKWSEKNS
ncbi:hypothetical protein ACG94X_08170 [Acinetobacter sp. ULE_I010]|uniref:hypothetical protein n=1 Tax=Acinetobacter sp. ULE_I010 TaxID=3373065 RepID=UPI003AF933DB